MKPLVLSAAAERAFDRMAADMRRVLGDRFVALVAYEPASGVVFSTGIDAADLDALSALAESWHRDGLRTPLLMTPGEFHRSLDAFPLEYQAILDRHAVIAGESPFGGSRIAAEDLRRACEVQAKAQLIHLRQGWLEAAGHPDELAELIERSATPLRVLLTNVARLNGVDPADDQHLARAVEENTGMPRGVVSSLLELETAPERSRTLVPRLPAYLAALEQLWAFVDTWRSR